MNYYRPRLAPLAVMLSTVLLAQLRKAWLEQRPEGPWLFPGQRRNEPLGARQVRKVWEMAQVQAGLRRHYPYHALRGAFATHLLDGGAALQTVRRSRTEVCAICTRRGQVLLGHAQLSSTTRYVAVQRTTSRTCRARSTDYCKPSSKAVGATCRHPGDAAAC